MFSRPCRKLRNRVSTHYLIATGLFICALECRTKRSYHKMEFFSFTTVIMSSTAARASSVKRDDHDEAHTNYAPEIRRRMETLPFFPQHAHISRLGSPSGEIVACTVS